MLDDELLAFSERLPADYKLKGLQLRWFFKEALRGFLPDEIIVKKKQGFGLPFGVWATRDANLARAGGGLARQPGHARHRPPAVHPEPAQGTAAGTPRVLRRDGVDPDDAGAVAQGAAAELQGLSALQESSAGAVRAGLSAGTRHMDASLSLTRLRQSALRGAGSLVPARR